MTELPTKPAVCTKCGGEMPPLSDDLARLARAHGGVVLAHDVCPGEKAAAAGRTFEVRVQIVDVTAVQGDDPDIAIVDKDEELIAFKARLQAADLDSAMRPLAEALGEKWMAAEKQAKLADGLTL